jgi:hypothetical protein
LLIHSTDANCDNLFFFTIEQEEEGFSKCETGVPGEVQEEQEVGYSFHWAMYGRQQELFMSLINGSQLAGEVYSLLIGDWL